MNTVTQIALGILILGAAFIFGNQIRKQSAENQQSANDAVQPEYVWQKPPYQPGTASTESDDDGLIDMPVAKKRSAPTAAPAIPKPATLKLPPAPSESQPQLALQKG